MSLSEGKTGGDLMLGGKECGSRTSEIGTLPSAKLGNLLYLDPTCLLRCLACFGVVMFHVSWYVGRGAEDKHAFDTALGRNMWLVMLFNPEPAMQAFLCLTG